MALSISGYGSETIRLPGPTVPISSADRISDVQEAGFFDASSENAAYIFADQASDSWAPWPSEALKQFSKSG
ncbi:Uncharacterised protein [Mycobacteroides abscessus subsp. abscessus]|nr:Uncharacterised protein [Mycobacteroides abscessus subsp. abscessus]